MRKRDFLAGGVGVGAGALLSGVAKALPAATPPSPRRAAPHRKAKTTPLFKAPGLYPNALAVAPEG